jgi:hypothetical protein
MTTNVVIDSATLKYLQERDEILSALEAGGVDNWEGYDEALSVYAENDDDDDDTPL